MASTEEQKSSGYTEIAILLVAVCFCWFYDFSSEEKRALVSGICCALASVYTFLFKLSVEPTSVFMMTAMCSILNAIAVGSYFTYKFFVSITAPVSLIQSLVMLPVKF